MSSTSTEKQAWIDSITEQYKELQAKYQDQEASVDEKRRLATQLRQAEAALHAIREHDAQKGICVLCGAIIPGRRLEILPFTVWCVGCAEPQDRRGKGLGEYFPDKE